jgi:hypothetical protein
MPGPCLAAQGAPSHLAITSDDEKVSGILGAGLDLLMQFVVTAITPRPRVL